MLSYFIGNKMFDKSFVFETSNFKEEPTLELPIINKKGIIGK